MHMSFNEINYRMAHIPYKSISDNNTELIINIFVEIK